MDKKGKILVVDDNPKNIQVLGNILNDNNYDVEVALGGREAIEWLKEDAFDLMLLDIMMPEINGFEVCQTLRKDSKYDIMPIVYLSAKNDKESTVHGFNVGGQDFINKPFDTAELLARVNTHIELKKSKEQILEANNLLEEKVYQRTLELEASNKKLISITRTKDKFLSFIGKEITAPINALNKAVNLIKHSAESSRLSEMVRLLEESVYNLDFITKLASQITQINNKAEFSHQDFYLNGILEHLLIHNDELIEKKNLQLHCDVDDTIKVNGSIELIKNSISGILETIIKNSNENSSINIILNTHDDKSELSISFEQPNWDSNDIHSMPEETVLFFSYADIVMDFHEGSFTITQDENHLISFKWSFN